MIVQTLALVLCTGISVVSGQFLNCNWVQSLNCTSYPGPTACATDGNTYPNRCFFARAQCIDKYLHILHDGACQPGDVTTTPAPGSGTDGEVAVLDFFCTALSQKECPKDIRLVCGTNGRTYQNYCEYDKGRCTHRDVHVQSYGPCPTDTTTLKP